MKDQHKTREELISENEELRRRVAVLEKASQEDQLATALLQVPSLGIHECDTEGRITFGNPSQEAITGYTADELAGTYIWDHIERGPERDALPAYLAHLVSEQPAPTPFFAKNITKSGEVFDVRVDWNYERNPQGQVTGFVCIVSDITEQKRAEEALRESEERYRLLAEAIPHPVWRSDAEGRQIDCNCRWQEYTGQTPEEAQGNGWMKALHPDDVAWAIQRVGEDVPGGNIYQAEYRLRRASDNSYHWHLARAIPRRDANGTILGWFGSAVDIEDLKQVQEALAEREARLLEAQEALQKAHDELERRVEERTAELVKSNEELAMFQKFAASSGQGFSMADLDGHLLYLNPALCRMLGEERPADRIGQHLSTCYSEESNRRGKQEIEPALKQRGYWEGELAMLSRQGKAVPTWHNAFIIRDESGNPVRMAVVVTDFTERKQAEEALQRSEERLRLAQQVARVGTFEWNIRTGLNTWTPELEALYGLSPGSFSKTETAWENLIYSADRAEALRLRGQTLETGQPVEGEWRVVWPDGSVHWLAGRWQAFKDATGKPLRMIGVNIDISERKQAEEKLERERQSLWRMLQASDHERQTISYEIHDGLAQYLAAANMQLQVFDGLRESNPKEAKKAYDAAAQLVSQSHSEARRLISEVRPPVIDEIGVETAISHLVHEQRQRGGPTIKFDSDVYFKRLPSILENAIYRIAQEALTNACRHSKSKKVAVTMTQEGQDVRLEVQDWGIGFDPESVEQGHFGLEGIRQRVRLLDGKLAIETTPGSGTLVQVVVPILERQNDG